MDRFEKNREIIEGFPNTWHNGSLPEYDYRRRVRRLYFIGAAAAALLLPLAILGLWKIPAKNEVQKAALASYHVDKGVKGSVVLPDSTVIILNSASTVNVLSDFSSGERRVYLDGEGWFEVKADPEHPFWVETPSGISVKVTGTRFNLSNYREEGFMVLLAKGSIELAGDNPDIPAKLAPSQQISVRNGQVMTAVTDERQQRNVTAWREGVLVFEDKPLREVIPMLERWYGVHFNILSVDLLRETLTGEFDTETIQEVMNVLSLTHRFFYNIDGKEITIALRQ